MPLKRLKEEYLEQDGVRFLMEDEAGSTVACRVSHEALRDHADRMHFSGTDGAVFDAYRELIEEVASEAHDAEGPFERRPGLSVARAKRKLLGLRDERQRIRLRATASGVPSGL